jgi:hypothetical protein
VSENPTAIHVQTGDASWGGRIDAWLARHGVAVEPFTDAYAACARLVQLPARVPALAFVGCDWLSESERALLGRICETWPACAVVAYARDSALLPQTTGSQRGKEAHRIHTIATDSELVRILAGGPELVRQRPPEPHPAPQIEPRPTPIQPAERAPDAVQRAGGAPQGVAGVLTAREIAILLGEDGG